MKNFKLLKVWQNGLEIAVDAYRLVQTFPREERFGLASQITRAATSISSNIAEGSSKSSLRHYLQYLETALGSSFELETHILLASRIGIGDAEMKLKLLLAIAAEQKMLHGFIAKLKARPDLKNQVPRK